MSKRLTRICLSAILLFSFAFFASPAQAVEPGGTCPEKCVTAGDCDDKIDCSTDTCDSNVCLNTATCPNCTGGTLDDYCVVSVAGDQNWSDASTWVRMTDGGFPGDGVGRCGLLAVVSEGASITLDTDATINGGRIINEGTILVKGNHALTVPDGTILIREAGRYLADPDTGAGTTASLSASDITLRSPETGCGPGPEMIISESMTVETTGSAPSSTGNFVLDLNGTFPCASSGANAASLGGKTPPILRVEQPTTVLAQGQASAANPLGVLNIAGSFEIIVAAEICVGCELTNNPVPIEIVIGADFINGSKYPKIFNWIRGVLRFPAGSHTFEVAGIALGAFSEGFSTSRSTLTGTGLHTNFSMDHIHIEGNVTFKNEVANTVGAGLGQEALYVRKLTLGPGAAATTDGSRVFYCEFENNTGLKNPLNGANFIPISDCPARPTSDIPAVSTWGVVILAAMLLCVGTVIAKRRTERWAT